MAFSIRRREEKKAKEDLGILDAGFLQELQDHFCDANNLYLACVSRKYGIITKAYGSREELSYIHSKVDMDMHVQLLNRLICSDMENVVEMNCRQNITRMCGVAIRVNGEIIAIWIAVGIMEGSDEEMPEYMQCTTPDRFYKSIEFLETLSKQFFAVKREEQMAQEAFMVSRASETKMEEQLHRNEVMTSVVKMLESENEFTKIADDILRSVSEYLHISNAALLQENASGEAADMICEYTGSRGDTLLDTVRNIEKEKIPFFNGKPHMISSNSMMQEEFRDFFAQNRISAGVFLPIEMNGKNSMYLCFFERGSERIWDINDIKFMNDVKRIIQSILAKRIAKKSLTASYASLEAILENMRCGIYVKEPADGRVLYTNQKFQAAFGEILEKYGMDNHIAETLASKGCYQEYFFEEEQRWLELDCNRIKWVDGKDVELSAVFDITDKKVYQKKAEKQTNYDSLTGIYNRIRCEEDMNSCLRKTIQNGEKGAFLYLDLDDFKYINDGLGHHYGDILLQNIAKQLAGIPGLEDSCYRVGGDEFAMIVKPVYERELYRIIEDIGTLFSRPWMLKGKEYYCTMSMSVVRFPTEGDRFETIIKKADAALFDAKDSGKNRIIFYDETIDTGSYKRLDMEKNMRNAARSRMEEFLVYYQPIVDVSRPGQPCKGAEALVRWQSSELGFVLPGDFIPLAEYLGLIVPIGEYILKEACSRCKYWNDMGQPDFSVNVNLSVVQLLQPDIVDVIRSAVLETGILPEHLHLEVTESLAVNDMELMKRILADIKSLGVKVALDDFGTGYSSLNHIREMPIDLIKIDRCFIMDIARDNYSHAFVKMVTELARTIQVETCVEGVEDAEQAAILKGMNVQLMQGYFYGKPMEAAEFEKKYVLE